MSREGLAEIALDSINLATQWRDERYQMQEKRNFWAACFLFSALVNIAALIKAVLS